MKEIGKQKIKILHLLRSDTFSGAENVVFQIIDLFRDEPVEMIYCSPDGDIAQALKANNITFWPIKRFSIREVKRVVKDYKPDLIHAHDISASVAAAFAAGKARIISHMHVNHQSMHNTNLRTLLYLACAIRFEHIFWVSKSALQNYRFKDYISDKSSILHNIVDQDKIYRAVAEDSNTYDHDIMYLGRLTYQKNPARLLRVLSLAIQKKPDIKISIVGDGELLDEAQKLSTELGLDNNVRFWGYKSNPLKMLHDARVLILTSRFEGTPICALEAMALGVPIVSTPTDGMLNLIENGVNGYMSDDDTDLAYKIVELLSDKKKHLQFADNSKQRFNRLNDVVAYKNELKRIYMRRV